MTQAEKEGKRFGLNESVIAAINRAFSKYPAIEQALIYGSRAKGDFRPGSDIDLTLVGEDLQYSHLLRIENDLDALLLPYKCDLSLHRQIDNRDLLTHIERVGIVFYRKEDQP